MRCRSFFVAPVWFWVRCFYLVFSTVNGPTDEQKFSVLECIGNVLIVLFGIIIMVSVKVMINTSLYTFGEGALPENYVYTISPELKFRTVSVSFH